MCSARIAALQMLWKAANVAMQLPAEWKQAPFRLRCQSQRAPTARVKRQLAVKDDRNLRIHVQLFRDRVCVHDVAGADLAGTFAGDRVM